MLPALMPPVVVSDLLTACRCMQAGHSWAGELNVWTVSRATERVQQRTLERLVI